MWPLGWSGRGFVGALAVTVLLPAACLGPVLELRPPRSGEASVTIYIVGHDWHTGIVIRIGCGIRWRGLKG